MIWHMHAAHVRRLLVGRALPAWRWVRAGQGEGGGGIQLAQLQHISLLNSSEMLQREVSHAREMSGLPGFSHALCGGSREPW